MKTTKPITLEVRIPSKVLLWNLTPKFRKILEPIAAEFGWTPEEFLVAYSHGHDRLPGQYPMVPMDDDEPNMPSGFSANAFAWNKALWLRIQNAARMHNETPEEFVWKNVWGMVTECEASMIVSPKDGRFLIDHDDFKRFRCDLGPED